MTDQYYMQLALELARKGLGKTSPNPAVGCVIVKKGKVIGQGWHKKCGGPHAEVFALAQAGAKANGAVMYVTLEPCAHQGRTPPCVDQVIASGIQRVVVAMKDPNPKVKGRAIQKMRWAGITVDAGCLEDAARQINRPFCKWIETGLPLVTVKIAQTLDGKTASSSGNSKWITSPAARACTHQMRDEFDAILVGVNTVLRDDPELNPVTKKNFWTKVVLDSRLRISLNAKLLKSFKTVVATTEKAPVSKIRRLQQQGVEVIVCPLKKDQVNLKMLLKELGKREITHVLIEGGAHVIGSALKERVVDRMIAVVAPKILGDQNALSAVSGLNILDVNKAIGLDVEAVREVGGDWVFEGVVKY
jgi:diaminohydroxyphosphoribosylaminopyrimidine deaminase/5-amino-6-(5-phosphoribosylamino)uracil reductase